MFLDDFTNLSRVSARLSDRIAIADVWSSVNKNPFTVPEIDRAITASKLGLDHKNTGWPNDHVIDIKTIARDPVDNLVIWLLSSSRISPTFISPASPRFKFRNFGSNRRHPITAKAVTMIAKIR